MIFGVGVDIAKVSRFEKWAKNPALIERFFNERERISATARLQRAAEHYASRFAAKEAFSKSLGTGFSNLVLADFWVEHGKNGEAILVLGEKTQKIVREILKSDYCIHLSISHEKEFAVAFVVLEKK